MPPQNPTFSRCRLLQNASLAIAASASVAWAQPGKPSRLPTSIMVAQIVDFSQAQQDVSKDFLIGSRAAWQQINLRSGLNGRQVQHLAVETDGSPTSLRTALDSVKANPVCVVMSGSVGDQLTSQIVEISRHLCN